MLVTIAKRFTFDAAHRLPALPPTHKCHHLHGHTYAVEFVIGGEVDPATGFLIDYDDIAKAWKPLAEQLDHKYLNEIPGLECPSTEVLASWIAHRFAALLATQQVHPLRRQRAWLRKLRVCESSSTWCEVTFE